MEGVEEKEGEWAQNAKCLILPPVFWKVCVRKGVAGGNIGSGVSKGVAGGRFQAKTGKTRNGVGSVAMKGVSVLRGIIHV